MRYVYLFGLCCLISCSLLGQTKLKIDASCSLYLGNGTLMTLENVDIDNDGFFNGIRGSKLVLKGSSINDLGGTGTTKLATLRLTKIGAGEARLIGDVDIIDSISFALGKLDLNGNNIFLDPMAILFNESESHRIYGSTGSIEITQTMDEPSGVEPGNLGLIFDSEDLLGATRIIRAHTEQTADDLPLDKSILRYFDVFPGVANTGLDVDLTLKYFEAELNGIPEAELSMWRSDNSGGFWYEIGFTERDPAGNFVKINGLSSLSRFSLSSTGPLPVELQDFSVICTANGLELNWETVWELDNDFFSIEYSEEGRYWEEIAQINGGDGQELRSYAWLSDQFNTGYFRLRQTDFGGHSSIISNAIYRDCSSGFSWSVFPNPMTEQGNIQLVLSEDEPIQIELFNSMGQLIQKVYNGFLNQGEYRLQWTTNLPSGFYQLRLRTKNYQKSVALIIND